MRLATFNILNGRSLVDGAVDLGRFAAAIQALNPDVLGLQEVDRDQPRSHQADITAVAAEAMGAVGHRFAAAVAGTPGGTWVASTEEDLPGQAAYGIALLSRFPVRSWEVLRVPSIGPHVRLPIPGRGPVLLGEEPRLTIVAELLVGSTVLSVANTHLSLVPGWNRIQLRQITRRLLRAPGPSVIMGDLNLPGRVPAWITGFRPLAVHRTFPAARPMVQLDHILVRGNIGVVRRSEAVQLAVSDHRALVVEIDLP